MVQYLNDFYKAAVIQGYFTNSSEAEAIAQALTDPAQATAASAQSTANAALTLANTANERTEHYEVGDVTITGIATTAVVTLAATQPDALYKVVFSGEAFTGAPPAASFLIVNMVKTDTQFTLTLASAPGLGNSVTLAWFLVR